jgi:hypothetical protein
MYIWLKRYSLVSSAAEAVLSALPKSGSMIALKASTELGLSTF